LENKNGEIFKVNYFFGFSFWKHSFIEPFFNTKPIFINPLFKKNYLKYALKKGLDQQSNIYIWGKKSFPDVEKYAHKYGISLFRVEDGFIRSIGLGSDLTQPYSLVVDTRGLYFDPTSLSDLEWILETHVFDAETLDRAQKIKYYLIDKKLSKYNMYAEAILNFPMDKSIIVVPGQVEDDASIRYGASGMTNLELLKLVRAKRPDGYIVYKPHPDVLVGNRIGQVEDSIALEFCNEIVKNVSIDSVLSHADEVHTMTSLVGFEALIRGISVYTYGMPFYAGWGLSKDRVQCSRRTKRLNINELIAGALLLYPCYIHPETNHQCELEDLLYTLEKQRSSHKNSSLSVIRNTISRKVQLILRMIQK
jgi:capsular polysaccharide export protein